MKWGSQWPPARWLSLLSAALLQPASRLIVALLPVLLLAGCSGWHTSAPLVRTDVPASWQRYQHWMSTQQHWELSGKVGIRTARESNSAGVSWQQQGELTDITLSGPFNAQAARIQSTPVRVTLDADGQRYQAESPEALLEQQLGWQLPVRELAWWVRGLPAPDSPWQQQLENERLKTLSQKGWQIRYSRYSEDLQLPEKLVLRYETLRVVLVIHDWTIFQ
ncbi:MAG: lipoprotein insertase outer membrane protein LolB [Marinobacterium sp.]|nr:lipoprotein insertase outer membrane protein LolB [Marinobacterium sp.]